MNKFFKENWFKIGILIILLVALFLSYFIINSSLQEKQAASLSARENLNIQNCSKQAQIVKDDTIKTLLDLTAENNISVFNHYNKNLDKCIVQVEYFSGGMTKSPSDHPFHTIILEDAYEGGEIADCIVDLKDGSLTNCMSYIKDVAHGTEITQNQFDSILKEYLEN